MIGNTDLYIGDIGGTIYGMPLGTMLVTEVLLAFFAILFLQSGIDKVTDRKGNLEWLTGHFKKSPLANFVPALLGIITLMEVATGAYCLVVAIALPFITELAFFLPFIAFLLAAINLLMLFFGQRMAKDYGGAAGLVPYFLVALVGLLMHMTFFDIL